MPNFCSRQVRLQGLPAGCRSLYQLCPHSTPPHITVAVPALFESESNTRTPVQVSTKCARKHPQVQGETATANDNLLLESCFNRCGLPTRHWVVDLTII